MKEWMKKIVKFLIKFIASAAILFMIMSIPYFFKADVDAIARAQEIKSNVVTQTIETEVETTLDGEPVIKKLDLKMADYYELFKVSKIDGDIMVAKDLMKISAVLGLIIAVTLSLKENVRKYAVTYSIGYISITTIAIIIAMFKNYFETDMMFYTERILRIAVPIFIIFTVLYCLTIFIHSILEKSKKEKLEQSEKQDITENKVNKFLLRFISITAIIFYIIVLFYFIKAEQTYINIANEAANNKVQETKQTMMVTTITHDPVVESMQLGMVDYYQYQAECAVSCQALTIFAFVMVSAILGLTISIVVSVQIKGKAKLKESYK